MVTVVVSRPAADDLDDITIYSQAMWDAEQADLYVGGLLALIEQLKSFPEMGQAVSRRHVRRLVHQKHVIFYRFVDRHVTVLRITSVRAAMPLGLGDE